MQRSQDHAFLGAGDDHAGHLETAQCFAQNRTPDTQRCGQFYLVGNAAAGAQALLLEEADQTLFDTVDERGIAVVQFQNLHLW